MGKKLRYQILLLHFKENTERAVSGNLPDMEEKQILKSLVIKEGGSFYTLTK